jgi:hypothetical protein
MNVKMILPALTEAKRPSPRGSSMRTSTGAEGAGVGAAVAAVMLSQAKRATAIPIARRIFIHRGLFQELPHDPFQLGGLDRLLQEDRAGVERVVAEGVVRVP